MTRLLEIAALGAAVAFLRLVFDRRRSQRRERASLRRSAQQASGDTAPSTGRR